MSPMAARMASAAATAPGRRRVAPTPDQHCPPGMAINDRVPAHPETPFRSEASALLSGRTPASTSPAQTARTSSIRLDFWTRVDDGKLWVAILWVTPLV